MDLEYIVLSEVIQSQDKKHVLPHIWIVTYNMHVCVYICKQMYIWVQYNIEKREQEEINVG